MTREEEFASLYRNGTVYRPLQEEHSILVEVGLGCGWHKCAFCDFTRDPFCWIPLEEGYFAKYSIEESADLILDPEKGMIETTKS